MLTRSLGHLSAEELKVHAQLWEDGTMEGQMAGAKGPGRGFFALLELCRGMGFACWSE
jgi:hypothetical protein